jgi:hypothetical protein
MKIASFERVDNEVTATLEDGMKVVLDWSYIIEKRPQIGDDFDVAQPSESNASEVEEVAEKIEKVTKKRK